MNLEIIFLIWFNPGSDNYKMNYLKKIIYILGVSTIVVVVGFMLDINPFQNHVVIEDNTLILNSGEFMGREIKTDFGAGEKPVFLINLSSLRSSSYGLQANKKSAKMTDSSKIAYDTAIQAYHPKGIISNTNNLSSLRSTSYGLQASLSSKDVDGTGVEPVDLEMISPDRYHTPPTSNSLYHTFLNLNTAYAAESVIPDVKVSLTNPSGENIEVDPDLAVFDKSLLVTISDDGLFKPGVWKLNVDIELGKRVLRAQQNFSWGVVALNVNKAVYFVNTEKTKTTSDEMVSDSLTRLPVCELDNLDCSIANENNLSSTSLKNVDPRGVEPLKQRLSSSQGKPAGPTSNSLYHKNYDTAYIQMAVLDDMGHTVCNSELNLTIVSPSGEETILQTNKESQKSIKSKVESTVSDGTTIYYSDTCGADNVTDNPDYFAYYDVTEIGEYTMKLTARTENGVRTITDKFSAVAYAPSTYAEASVDKFEIERIGATRIWPAADYEMVIKVKSFENFLGNIIEIIPAGFEISQDKLTRIKNKYSLITNTEIIWKDVSIKAGETIEITYIYDAPDISPEFYLLGPLQFISADEVIYTEPRVWQIASDAVNATYITASNKTGLVGYWDMDDNNVNGTTVYDKSGQGNDGTSHTDPDCPTGYAFVPGNSLYNTSDFCVMQYEAKYNADDDVNGIGDDAPTECKYNTSYDTWDWGKDVATGCGYNVNETAKVVSTAEGSPIAGITHTQALTACPAGDHIITNDEWMTIARDAEQVNANWTGGEVGSGCLFAGNNGDATCGYDGDDPEKGTNRDARAKFILSSGEEIYDIAGNVWEHVELDASDTLVDIHPTDGGVADWRWIEFTAITDYGDLSYNQIRPSNSSWNATQGMGRLYTYNGTFANRVFLRGGRWSDGASAGAFTLDLCWDTSIQSYNVGFRCAR